MGYIKDEIAEDDQEVKGIIIAFEDDQRIKRALSVTNNIEFYRYRINFNLTGINRSEYEAAASELTTAFSEIPGLKRKHWLANEDNNTFGGVYIFDTKESHDAFVESELYAGVRGNPSFSNFTGKSFENIDSLAKHTRGTE